MTAATGARAPGTAGLREGDPPLRGPALAAACLGLLLAGALLGVVSAFLVPVGPRLGAHDLPAPAPAAPPPPVLAAARLAESGVPLPTGVTLSVGVALALLGCLALGVVGRVGTGERVAALAPVTGWAAVAVLAGTVVHGGVVLPEGYTEGAVFLYAGLLGGLAAQLPVPRRRPAAAPPAG